MVHYARNTGLWKRFEESLLGVKNLKHLEVKNMEMLKKFVKEGFGFSMLGYFGLMEEVGKGDLKALEYAPLNGIPRDIMSVYLTGSSRTEWIKEFVATCENQIKKLA